MRTSLFLTLCFFSTLALAQDTTRQIFTRADTLRGMLTPERTCYDVRFYHLDIRVDPAVKSINGAVTIRFSATRDFQRLQIDLFQELKIDRIVLDNSAPLTFKREFGAVFVDMPKLVRKGEEHDLVVSYGGIPHEAKNPPWDGGVTWTKDEEGNPWVAVTCQGIGASIWWPNKDHQSDEPDSMLISITVPPGLMDISNGRLRKSTTLPDGWTRYDWFVSSPINNYCVTMNVGKYAHFADTYKGEAGPLTLDYYVMPYNLAKAKVQFTQVQSMMRCFEEHFGPYPFYRDGYKLVECPHTGMEHQSAVAYGNHYVQGYRGRASSPPGLRFDFIIIHESAHEWWGNSLTAADVADMWIHESFGAYAEAVYVECMWGHNDAVTYVNGKKSNVRNSEPIIGIYNVNHEGSGDMYDKGQLMLHTLRNVIDNDSLWFSIIRGLATQFHWRILKAEDIFSYINGRTGTDYQYFFDQYLKHPKLPVLEIAASQRGTENTLRYRWRADVQDFRMPIKVTTAPGRYGFIHPTTTWQTTPVTVSPEEFKVDEKSFYCEVRLRREYLDPNAKEERRGNPKSQAPNSK